MTGSLSNKRPWLPKRSGSGCMGASPLAPHLALNGQLSKLLDLMTEARVKVIANPLINITIQRRHDTYPKGRGMTRVKEQMARGLVVAKLSPCHTLDEVFARSLPCLSPDCRVVREPEQLRDVRSRLINATIRHSGIFIAACTWSGGRHRWYRRRRRRVDSLVR